MEKAFYQFFAHYGFFNYFRNIFNLNLVVHDIVRIDCHKWTCLTKTLAAALGKQHIFFRFFFIIKRNRNIKTISCSLFNQFVKNFQRTIGKTTCSSAYNNSTFNFATSFKIGFFYTVKVYISHFQIPLFLSFQSFRLASLA